ncbi:hypothetical protein Zmor_024936 [Zophobas morio]|uniref:Odorant receptor n=1 Tax=Zophobas morio TaxID=2755281 RepID=A0AA38M4E4_9CUCU|nr:hypothetical protein Zmor_024936 [Zophobas morio]
MKGDDKFLNHSLKQLRIRQFWTQKGHPVSFAFYFRYFLSVVICSPFWVGLLLHFITVIKDDLDVNLSGDVSNLTSVIGLHFMSFSIVWRHKKIADLIDALTASTEFGKPDNFDKTVRKLNLYSKSYACYCVSGTFIYALLRTQEIPRCLRNNEEKGLHEVCGTMIPTWTPFDINFNRFPNRQLLLIVQMTSVLGIICGGTAISFTTFEIATVIVLKMKHLRRLLKHAFDDPKDVVWWKNLDHCIKYHRHIIKLQELFDMQYKYPNGSYVVLVGIVIAGLANQYMKERNFGAIIHLGGWVFSFYICCHAGQILLTESMMIPNALYNSMWYRVPVRLQKIVLMIITRSQRPMELHAAPIGVMSHELFITLVKTSTSYFALLSQST